jgi:hypothetical protein
LRFRQNVEFRSILAGYAADSTRIHLLHGFLQGFAPSRQCRRLLIASRKTLIAGNLDRRTRCE